MKILNKIYKFISDKYKTSKKLNQIKQRQILMLEASKTLQVLEFNGELYISYNGAPIINQSLLKRTLPETLEESRNVLQKWNSRYNK